MDFVTIKQVGNEYAIAVVSKDGFGICNESRTYSRKGNAIRFAQAHAQNKGLPYFGSITEGLRSFVTEEEPKEVEPEIEEIEEIEQEEIEEIATAEPTDDSMKKAEIATLGMHPDVKIGGAPNHVMIHNPWVVGQIEISMQQEDPDVLAIPIHMMTERLVAWVGKQMDRGRRDFKFAIVECVDCGHHRVVKTQDIFQTKKCKYCKNTKTHR